MDSELGLCRCSQKVCEFVKPKTARKAGLQLLMHWGLHAADLHANCFARNYILQGRHSLSDCLPFPLVFHHLAFYLHYPISLPPKKKNTPPCPQNEARHLEIMGLLWSLQSWKPVVKMTLGIQAHYMALCKRVTWSDLGQRNIHLEAWEKRNRRKTNLKAEHLLQ